MANTQRKEDLPAVATGTDLETFRGLKATAGAGLEELRAEDLATPFMLITDKSSPCLNRNHERYVPGGEPGMFFDKAGKAYYDGDEGLDIVMCIAKCDFNEWTPRKDDQGRPIQREGVGFHGSRSRDEPDVARLIEQQWPKGIFGPVKLPNGNHLIQTWAVYALWAPRPITENNARRGVFLFTSTKIRPYTDTAASIRALTYPTIDEHGQPDQVNPASWAHKWHITTRIKSDSGNSWYIPHFELTNGENWVDSLIRPNERLFAMGEEFHDLVHKGKVRANYAETSDDDLAAAVKDDDIPF